MQPVRLAPTEKPPGHRFADPTLYESDHALLAYLLQDLRSLMRRCRKGEIEVEPFQVLTWEVHGLQRRVVMCDPTALLKNTFVNVVGFFGDRKADADLVSLDGVEVGLLGEFRTYPGIMSYSSVELVDHHWANLVVHKKPEDREAWRGSSIHKYAVDRVAPNVYHGVRIHNGCIRGGVTGNGHVEIESTKYWDYDVTPTWEAIRVLTKPDVASDPLEATITGAPSEP
ncbi:MAG: hypothetical protein KJN63_01235 [Acidimicrobiia bacterium]|nr:hypothetical protein [Acidimicrobiia bacterium]